MDTPTIAAYYRESDPLKRKALLDQAIAEGEDTKENEIRKELWEVRYHDAADTGDGARADGFMALWMTLEFNRDAEKKWFAIKRARKEIIKHLEKLQFRELSRKSELHRELLYRECCHLVKLYMDLCEKDKSYNNMLCGLVSISSEHAKEKLQKDIRHTAVQLPAAIQLTDELEMITKAAREMYELKFPGEGGI
ncbi:MAG: hypothetical protein Q4C77_10565 [Eubacteriales bacterium]|nr:hypothetical protein [Eubacteriales bacterium]